jgi:hypothetical protein
MRHYLIRLNLTIIMHSRIRIFLLRKDLSSKLVTVVLNDLFGTVSLKNTK